MFKTKIYASPENLTPRHKVIEVTFKSVLNVLPKAGSITRIFSFGNF